MADGSRHEMAQVLETDYGVTPDTPVLTPIRHTGTTLGLSKESSASEELHSNRQVQCYRHGMRSVSGDINIEFASQDFDTLVEGAFCGTWAADVLTTGTERRSFTVVRQFTDLEAADKPFHIFTGVEYNSFNLTVTPNSIVTATFGVIGQDLALSETEITGSTYDTLTNDCPFDGFTGTVLEGGATIGIVTEISLTLENGLEPRPVVGDDKTLEPTIGMSMVTGNLTVYFEDSEMLEKFINETASSIEFSLEHSGKTYTFEMPSVIYTGGQPDVAGAGSITLSMPFQALYDDTNGYSISLTRVIV